MSPRSHWPAFRPFALLLLIVCVVRPGLQAVAQSGSVGGVIEDVTGASLPGARVTLESSLSFKRTETRADDKGRFSLSLPEGSSAGLFILVVEAAGYEPFARTIEIPQKDIPTSIAVNLTVQRLSVGKALERAGYTVVDSASTKLVAVGEPLVVKRTGIFRFEDVSIRSLFATAREVEASDPSNNEVAWWENPIDTAYRLVRNPSWRDNISIEARVDLNGLTTPVVTDAKPDPRKQRKTAIFSETQTVVTSNDPDRITLPWLRHLPGLSAPPALAARGFGRLMPRSFNASRLDSLVVPPAQGGGSAANAPGVKLFFVDTGRSSGASVKMTVVNEGAKPITIVGGAFVLEPVQGLSERDVAREIARLKSRKSVSVTIDAYCLNMRKPAPDAGMVMRLVAKPEPAVLTPVQKIASAARVLYDARQIQPDSDPLQYRHALLQWAIWTQEQQFIEQTFTQAFIDHSRENLESAGQRWTPALEGTLRKLAPGRWRNIQRVFRLARLPMVGDAR